MIAVAVGAIAIIYERYDTKTLKRTIQRDAVLCGVNAGLPAFSTPDDKGNWSGFDVDSWALARHAPTHIIQQRTDLWILGLERGQFLRMG